MDLERDVALFVAGVEVPLGLLMGVMALLSPDEDGAKRSRAQPSKPPARPSCSTR